MANVPLTQQSVQNALSQLAQWFPEHAANINTYQAELTQNILNNTAPAAGSPLAQLQMPPTPAATEAISMVEVSITPCEEAIGEALFDVGLFILSLVGISETCNQNVTRSILNELGQDTLNGFSGMFHDFQVAQQAGNTTNMAKALFNIAGSFYRAGGFKIMIEAWEDQASWYDWIETGVVAVAQFVVWFASDGTAFIAEVVIAVVSATSMIQGIVNAVETCGSNNCNNNNGNNVNPATTMFVPTGSYTFTASNIEVMMTANCKNTAGQYVPAEINITPYLALMQFQNNGGVLQTQGITTQVPATYAPLGSYTQTSDDVQVILSADCKTVQGNVVSSSLNITNLALGQTVSNINGVLTVDQN